MARSTRRRSSPRCLRPVLADEVELAGERVGRSKHGRLERVPEAPDLRRELRAGAEIVGQRGGHSLVDRLLLEAGVFKELAEGFEGGVDVGDPEEKQLLDGGFAVGEVFGGALEPLSRRELAAVDGDVGEQLGEPKQQLFHLGGLRLGGEPAQWPRQVRLGRPLCGSGRRERG